MADNVELVRRLWTAFERGGIEAVLEIADPDVEWEPYGGGGVVYRGHDGLRAYMDGRRERNEHTDARLYSAFAKGDYVVARGEVRIHGPQGIVTMQPGWLYEFRDGKLIRFSGYPTQEAALRAAGLAPQDGKGTIRELWAAAGRRDLDTIVALCAEDAVWEPYNAARPAYHGPEGVREFYEERFSGAQTISVSEFTIREIGDALVYMGSLHTVDLNGAVAQRHVNYVFWVTDGKIKRGRSFAQRGDAIAAAEAAAKQTPG